MDVTSPTRLAKRTGRPKSALAREALRKQLAIQRFRELRCQAIPPTLKRQAI